MARRIKDVADDLSLEQLRELLSIKEKMAVLEKTRGKLRRDLDVVEAKLTDFTARIDAIGKAPRKRAPRKAAATARRRPGRTAAKGKTTLEDVVVALLKKAASPMPFQDILKAIESGRLFKSRSADFSNVLRRTLSTAKTVKRFGRGVYGLPGMTASAASAGTAKKATRKTAAKKKAAKKKVARKKAAKKTAAKKTAAKTAVVGKKAASKKTAKKAVRKTIKKATAPKKTVKATAGRKTGPKKAPIRKKAVKKPASGKRTLEEVVAGLIRSNGGPMEFRKILTTIQQKKLVKTRSANFANVLRRTLSVSKLFKREGRGIYNLK